MADIVAGMTIQASWFTNIDSTGALKRTITVLHDSPSIKLSSNSVEIASIDGSGNLSTLGNIKDNAPAVP